MKQLPSEVLASYGFDVSRETIQRLEVYVSLLLRWNGHINLISRADEGLIWKRHIADALQLIALMPIGVASAIDLGSGAGLPGLILSLATGVPFTLVEADARKAAFLREAARETNSPATIAVGRIERLVLQRAPLLTARALAPLTNLLAMAAPFLAPDGVCLFPKGAMVEQELTAAEKVWEMTVERQQSRIDPQGSILRIREVSRVR